MENIRKHRNIKLVTNREAYLKLIMKPNFKSGVLFGENLMGCEITGEKYTKSYYENIMIFKEITKMCF